MQLSQSMVILAIEIYVLLILISGMLLFYGRSQRLLVRRQQEKLQQTLSQLRQLQLAPAPIQTTASYRRHLQAQLLATRSRYEGLNPGGDIAAIHSPADSPAQRGLALRYLYLKAEEEATVKGDGPLLIDWQVFDKLAAPLPILADPSAEANDELANYKKRVENLEKFKHLFFDMEQQWQDAQKQAEIYLHQLMNMANSIEDKESFMDILTRYQGIYTAIGQSLAYGSNGLSGESPPPSRVISRIDPKSSEEIIKLRNVAADQHRVINQLQRKLEEAASAEAKEAVILELKQQLQRQIRFVQEAETCIRVLEDELTTANERLNKQHQDLQAAAQLHLENQRIKETLEAFTLESKELMKTILLLEKENEALKVNSAEAGSSAELEKLRKIQTEFNELQTQYVALETKYLDLKLGG